MLIQFNKKDVILETSALCTGLIIEYADSSKINLNSPTNKLNFEGFSGFNVGYIVPILNILKLQSVSKYKDVYKSYNITGNLHNDDKIYSAKFYIFKNIKDTAFLFKPLKSFGITLCDLRLGYGKTPESEILYLDKKIIKVLNTIPEEAKQQLGLYFYCITKFLNAVETSDINFGTYVSNDVSISSVTLEELYDKYGSIPETLNLNCLSLKEDVYFTEIVYKYNNYLLKNNFNDRNSYKYTSSFVYNVIKTSTSENLCIINTTTKDYYLINKTKGIIYTNNELKEFNVFDSIEWIPNLVNDVSLAFNLDKVTVKHFSLDILLNSKDAEVCISNDVSNYEDLLEHYGNITENTSLKVYDGYFKTSKVKFEGGVLNLENYYKDDKYAQELYKQIQPYYETFDLKDLTGAVKGISKGEIYSMLFEGESGTGKSTAARVIATRCGIPFIAINCSNNIEESDMFGAMIPNPNKKSADDAEFIWKDGPLTLAIRNGYFSIIEELGGARPGILMKLNSLLDEARQVDLPNGEVLKAHPNFRIVATTNIGYEGTNRLNKALVNRFEICKKFEELHDKEIIKIIESRLGYTNVDKINKILDVYRAIKIYSNEQNLGVVISIRQLLNIFKQGKYYKNAGDAINNLLLNQAFLEEPEHLKYFRDTVLNAFDMSFKL